MHVRCLTGRSDLLVFARPQKKKTDPPKYKSLKAEKLFSITVKDIDEFTFEISTTTRAHQIAAESAKLKTEWLTELKQVDLACSLNNSTFISVLPRQSSCEKLEGWNNPKTLTTFFKNSKK
jgi:hypothetical protein